METIMVEVIAIMKKIQDAYLIIESKLFVNIIGFSN